MALIQMAPNYWDIAEYVKTILQTEHDNIVATLEDQGVVLPYDSINIHLGHWTTIQHWPVVEIVGGSNTRPWLAQAYIRDQTFRYRVLCGISNVDRTERDKQVSLLAAIVMAILDARENKSYGVTVGSQSISIYDSGVEDGGTVTLNQGTMYAQELDYFARVTYQIPDSIYV